MNLFKTALALAPAVLVTACATLFNGTTNTIKVESPTPAVSVSISNVNNAIVANVVTPAKLALRPVDGPFLLIFKDSAGHQQSYEVRRGVSKWVFGNVVIGGIGGLIGFGIDAGTKSLYVLKQDEVNMDMATGVNLYDVDGPRATSVAQGSGTAPVAVAVAPPVAALPTPAPTASVTAGPENRLVAGAQVKVIAGTPLLAQAKAGGRVLAQLDGREPVVLDTAMSNPGGQWWFVIIGSQSGWLAADRLTAMP